MNTWKVELITNGRKLIKKKLYPFSSLNITDGDATYLLAYSHCGDPIADSHIANADVMVAALNAAVSA